MWESSQGNSNYFDRAQEQEQFEEKQKLEKQKVELQKQELQVKQQQQDTQQLLVIGGLGIGATLVLVVAIYLFAKTLKGKKK
tara:strand:+ start:61 stop:306 length:246 start_codon:yes stop_codon:yes gene_type:complete